MCAHPGLLLFAKATQMLGGPELMDVLEAKGQAQLKEVVHVATVRRLRGRIQFVGVGGGG